jgi:ectoine hydroxylase-related dioxygenase (phytanoyl-CoA dioxygenase family)
MSEQRRRSIRHAPGPALPHVAKSILTNKFEEYGFAAVPAVVDASICASVARMLEAFPTSGAGSRRMLLNAWCQDLVTTIRSNTQIALLLPRDSACVQCTLFDKAPDKNWLVGLHQDRSIPVREWVADVGLSGWSEKEGDIFVQPSPSLLEQLAAVRVHIDACPIENGALRVVPGSHRFGLLTSQNAAELRARMGEVAIPAGQGEALVMRPLILHASSKTSLGLRRRVLHFVFGPRTLPHGLRWQHAI